jgi:hypothetical protein
LRTMAIGTPSGDSQSDWSAIDRKRLDTLPTG